MAAMKRWRMEKCLQYLFVVGVSPPRDMRRDGNRGAGGSGLPNGSFRGFGALRRLKPAIDKMGFRSATWVREGPT
jgi:hypothetical protein